MLLLDGAFEGTGHQRWRHRLKGDVERTWHDNCIAVGVGQRQVERHGHRVAGVDRFQLKMADRELAVVTTAAGSAGIRNLDAIVTGGGLREDYSPRVDPR